MPPSRAIRPGLFEAFRRTSWVTNDIWRNGLFWHAGEKTGSKNENHQREPEHGIIQELNKPFPALARAPFFFGHGGCSGLFSVCCPWDGQRPSDYWQS
jgi:hypothetical protein